MKDYYKKIQNNALRKNIVGEKFGLLTAIEMIYKDGEKTKVKCECDCGNTIITYLSYLTSGDTTSCGCYHKSRTSQANTKDFTGITSPYGIRLISQHIKNKSGVWLWKCECFCGKTFVALPAKVLNGHITSCGCAKKSSRERLIESILRENHIEYVSEYRFDDCKDKHPLPFDFYIPDYNTVIEYQGEQHYSANAKFGGRSAFKKQKRRDALKRNYCSKKNIHLLELPYTLSDEEIRNILQTLFIRRDCNGLHSNM